VISTAGVALKLKKPKVWLTAGQAQRMLDLARERSMRDYLLMSLMRWSIRVGEIVGWRGLPGIHPEEVREATIWIRGKGYARAVVQDKEVPVDKTILQLLRAYVEDNKIPKGTKIFPISEVWAEQIVKWYAKEAGVEDWFRVGPHRLRAFFATNAHDNGEDGLTIKDLMRHTRLEQTETYIGETSKEGKLKAIDRLSTLDSIRAYTPPSISRPVEKPASP
jgi:integrase